MPGPQANQTPPAPERTPDEEHAVLTTVYRAMDMAWTGRVADAIRILSSDPGARRQAFACTRLGMLYLETGKPQPALDAFARALAALPDHADALCNRGVALQRLGRLDEALAAYDATLRLEPANVMAHFNRGNVLRLMNRLPEAEAALARAAALAPKFAEAHFNRGVLLLMLRRPDAALAPLDAALALRPGVADIVQARAAALQALGRPVTPPPPGRPPPPPPQGSEAAVGRGRILVELGRYDEALNLAGRIPRQGPAGAAVEMVRAAALWHLGRIEEAVAAGEAALRLDPGNAELHEEFAYYCLKLGDLARGLQEYEFRLERPHMRLRVLAQNAPLWRGEDLAGKAVLVLPEQGHGDTLQFVRYLAPLAERGARVTAVVQPALLTLLKSSPLPVTWTTEIPADGHDYYVPLLSLAERFGTRLDTIPAEVPYLAADREKASAWADRLGDEGFKVGIAWQGNPNHPADHLRSIALRHYAPLVAVPGVRLVSLQALRGLTQLGKLPAGMAVEDLGPRISDNPEGMAEIAAVMANLDLVVTSDTSIAHLAGALGRPVWLAPVADPDWRWMRERGESPWYPTMRLFRQKKPGDWVPVFGEIAAALPAHMAERSPARLA